MKKSNKITATERDEIALWHAKGIGVREIGRRLGRHHTNISREIKRNHFKGHYVAIHAQTKTNKRKNGAGRRHPLKNPDVFRFTIEHLFRGWSPEQIAGKLKLDHPNNSDWHIHHETIYRFIYSESQKHRRWWEYLPRKQKRRRKQTGRSSQRIRIPNRVSIHSRLERANTREEFGHWEGDSVIGKRSGLCLQTEVERKSRYLKAYPKQSTYADSTIQAQIKIFSSLPKQSRKSTTLDNGSEFVLHTKLKQILNMDTYFADPYSSWQRGTNEYHNSLLRRYLPKGTSFDNLTLEELKDILTEINNRPRKCLNFYTPKEVFLRELKKVGGAIRFVNLVEISVKYG